MEMEPFTRDGDGILINIYGMRNRHVRGRKPSYYYIISTKEKSAESLQPCIMVDIPGASFYWCHLHVFVCYHRLQF